MKLNELALSLAATIRAQRQQAVSAVHAVMERALYGLMTDGRIDLRNLGTLRTEKQIIQDDRIELLIRYKGVLPKPDLSRDDPSPFLSRDATAINGDVFAALVAQRSSDAFWKVIPAASTEAWSVRAQTVAAYIKPGDRVVDLGCGGMALESFLPEGCTYVPVDIAKRDARTIVTDFNLEPLPPLGADVITALGVIEYLYDPRQFLDQIRAQTKRLILTYNPRTDETVGERFSRLWVVHHGVEEFDTLLAVSGWRTVEKIQNRAVELTYVLEGS